MQPPHSRVERTPGLLQLWSATLRLDQGQRLLSLRGRRFAARHQAAELFQRSLGLREPRLEMDHLHRHPSRLGVLNKLQVVAPPQLLDVIKADPRSIPARSLQRSLHLSRVAHAKE